MDKAKWIMEQKDLWNGETCRFKIGELQKRFIENFGVPKDQEEQVCAELAFHAFTANLMMLSEEAEKSA